MIFLVTGIKINNSSNGLIEHIKYKTFTEKLGTYYFEDEKTKESNIEYYSEIYGSAIGEQYRQINIKRK